MVAKTTNQSSPIIAALLKQCRKDGGPGYVGKIVNQDERIKALILADQEWAYTALMARRAEVIEHLHVSAVQIQRKIEDPLLAAAIALGGFVVRYL